MSVSSVQSKKLLQAAGNIPNLVQATVQINQYLTQIPSVTIMELVLFIGIQATGKSSFYKERFFRTHMRLNLDMLRTRYREDLLIKACIESKTKCVVENTNATKEERARYIIAGKTAGFQIIGYFFESKVADALQRNRTRPEVDRVPDVGIFSTSKRLELPTREEGFDKLFFVRLNAPDTFTVEDWKYEV